MPNAARGAVLGTVLPRRLRLLLALIVVEAYAVAFVPLYSMTGQAALILFCLVTAVAGGLLGVRGGLFVALVGLLLHALPFGVLAEVDPALVQPAGAAIYALAVVACAMGFGLMEDWRERVLRHVGDWNVTGSALRTAVSQLPMILFTLDRQGVFTLYEGNVRRALARETVAATIDLRGGAFEATFAPLRDAAGAVEGVICVGLDVTDQKQTKKELDDANQRDLLTGLPNRSGLMHRLEAALPVAKRETALLVLDLDRFKDVNDSIGHATGDELLRTLGERIFSQLGVRQQCARLGGDEFAIIAPDADDRAAAVLARTISDAIRAPISVDGRELFVTASIGVAIAPRDGPDAATLLRKAELAMYSAKRQSSAWVLYAPTADDPSPALLSLTSDLRRAIERNELALAFQPIVSASDGRITRFEALARWPRRDREVTPAEFVALAERVGLLTALTDWVVTAAVRQARTWMLAGLDAHVAVNLSPRNLLEPDLPRRIFAALLAAEVPAERFGIEVTESTIMTDPERAARTIGELRELGLSIAVDDFGTGHSSLAYLHRLPISTVKIDKSFIRGLAADANGRAIVSATIQLAHALEFKVVAEGCEDEATLGILRALGCDEVQGYHVARPLTPADAQRFLRR